MQHLIRSWFLALAVAASALAADPTAVLTQAAGRVRLVAEWDGADIYVEPPPVQSIAELAGTSLPNFLLLRVPEALEDYRLEDGTVRWDLPYRESISVTDPVSGAFFVVGRGIAAEELAAGRVPPPLHQGIRWNIVANLCERFGFYWAQARRAAGDALTPQQAGQYLLPSE